MVGRLVLWLALLGLLVTPLTSVAEPAAEGYTFNGDAWDDLAVGIPLEDIQVVEGSTTVNRQDAGAVNILFGGSSGLTGVGDQFWHQGLSTVSTTAWEGDRFGIALAAGDFDGDLRIDLAIGASYEDVGGDGNAGAVNVLYGSAGGLAADHVPLFHQDVGSIPGGVEANDYFGDALAVGDFDGDGYADLAVGVPFENLGSDWPGEACGAVNVLHGSWEGLTDEDSQLWTEVTLGWVIGNNCPGHNFGLALAAGDFDRDGFSDLAAAAPGEDNQAGVVHIIYGSEEGLTLPGQPWSQELPSLPGTHEDGDLFGHSLAVADFDGDTYSDLAIGVPGEGLSGVDEAGAVQVLYGSDEGLTATGNQLWHQNEDGVVSSPEPEDHFGWALAAGDLNGDGYADLAVGVPDEDVESVVDAGAVNVLYGSEFGLEATGDPAWNQDTEDVFGTAEPGDAFGKALAIGHSDGDTYGDLAVGVPKENLVVGSVNVLDAGAVNILYGSISGLSVAGNRAWHQNDQDVEDEVEPGDEYGSALAFGQWSTALPIPEYVTASDGEYTAMVLISWGAVPADYYLIYRSTPDGPKPREVLGSTTLTWYLDQVSTPGDWRVYWVQPCNVYGCGPFSRAEGGWRGIKPPQNVKASDGTYPNEVHVTWTATTGAEWYKLGRATSLQGDNFWRKWGIAGLGYYDTTASPDVRYYYWVQGCTGDPSPDFSLCSEWSDPDTGYYGETPPSLFLPLVVRDSD
jgi:hypothetical protein